MGLETMRFVISGLLKIVKLYSDHIILKMMMFIQIQPTCRGGFRGAVIVKRYGAVLMNN